MAYYILPSGLLILFLLLPILGVVSVRISLVLSRIITYTFYIKYRSQKA